jgi:ADP-ribose pyrophosphatase YjhB (NUDIX family)
MTAESVRAFVRVLITDEQGRVLVVAPKNSGGRSWNLPGGKVESGEAPQFAARREVLEETGLMLKSLTLVYEDDFKLDTTTWHGYFFVAEPHERQAYNLEPHKIQRVFFVDVQTAAEKGSRPFLVDTLNKLRSYTIGALGTCNSTLSLFPASSSENSG